MNKVYSELSEELLRRIINKGSDLVVRDLNISNYNNYTRYNFVYPSASSKGSDLSKVDISTDVLFPQATDVLSLQAYKYTGNKAGFMPLSTVNGTQKYLHPNSYSPPSLITIKEPLGSECIILSEFVSKSSNSIAYQYFPVGSVNNLIPRLQTWNYVNNIFSFVNTYPREMYLFPSSALDWEVIWTLGVNNMSHSFLPYFVFTGLVVCVGQHKHIMYEYTDIEGLYGSRDDVYLSSLKPLELDYPLGFPREGMLERDICYTPLVGEYPYEGEINRDLGGYTGLVTTALYHPIHKFYLYIRSDYSLFLSSRHPQPGAKQFVLNKRTELNLVRDPFVLPVITVPPLVEINDGIIKKYIYEYKIT